MLKLLTVGLLLLYIGSCAAQDLDLTPRPAELKTKFLFPRYNSTGPGPEDYECISERSADYYGVGTTILSVVGTLLTDRRCQTWSVLQLVDSMGSKRRHARGSLYCP